MQSINVLPSATGKWLKKRRPAHVFENSFPVERITEIAKGLLIGVRRRLIRGKQNGPRHRDANLGSERVVEKLFVRAPPKRVVHHCGSSEGCVLEPSPIKRDILRNPIDHHVITTWLALNHFVDPDKLGHDIVSAGSLIHSLDKCRREAVFLAKKNSNFFHKIPDRADLNG